MELTITDAQTVLADAYEGCSIAVNGVCLTVVTFDSAWGMRMVMVSHVTFDSAWGMRMVVMWSCSTSPLTVRGG